MAAWQCGAGSAAANHHLAWLKLAVGGGEIAKWRLAAIGGLYGRKRRKPEHLVGENRQWRERRHRRKSAYRRYRRAQWRHHRIGSW